MNWQRGFLRASLVVASLWFVATSALVWSNAEPLYGPAPEFVSPSGARAGSVQFKIEMLDAASKGELQASPVGSVFHRDNFIFWAAVSIFPPSPLLVFGALLRWAVRGFAA
jgi:hypothetical protein